MQTMSDDGDLVASAQRGDMAALEILLDRHHDRIRAVCAKVVGRGADADDAAQMALISIVKNLEKFDGRAKFSTWSYRIATNAAIDELRRRKRRDASSLDDNDHPFEAASGGDIGSATTAKIVVDDALEKLPDEFKIPVVLRDLCGLNYDEIGEVLDLAPGTVRSRIARGRGKLADIIGDVTSGGNQISPADVQEASDE